MNYKRVIEGLFLFLMFLPLETQAQNAERNRENNWVYPEAQKYVGMDFINTSTGVLINNGAVWYSHNFTNDGQVDFATSLKPGPALSQFSGSSSQRISGSGSTRFHTLFLGSSMVDNAFSLEQNINVAHRIDFIKGIVVASQSSPWEMNNMVMMETGSDYTNASDLSYVDGFVNKTGNTSFVFPIGDGGYYRPASISAPAAVTDGFAARYIYADPDKAGFLRSEHADVGINVSNNEYWILNRTAGTSNVQLTLSWDVTRTSASLPSELKKIKIVRWDGTRWLTENTVSTSGNFNEGTITADVSGYGVFTLATYSAVSVAVNDSVMNWEDQTISGNVLINDSVSDGNMLTVTGFRVGTAVSEPGTTMTLPGIGTIKIESDGTYLFTPELNYYGKVPAIRYTAVDKDKNTTGADLIIEVLPLPEIVKKATIPMADNEGAFTWKYTISLYNDTPGKIDSIQVEDNLDEVFRVENCSYTVTSLVASGKLVANGLYNGSTVIQTLLPGASLGVDVKDSINMEVKVKPNGTVDSLTLYNQALFSGQMIYNGRTIYFKNISSDANTTTSKAESTPTVLNSVTLFIPDGFSPNGDGINDKLVITHSPSTRIDLEVYNRWGILVYKSSDYQSDWDGTGMGTFLGKELVTGTYYCVYKQIKIATGEVVNKNVKFINLRRP